MGTYGNNLDKSKVNKAVPVVIILTVLSITMLFWLQARDTTSIAYKEYFDFRVREAVNNIENRMISYQQILHGARGLFQASEEVSRKEFQRYVFSLYLEELYPGIQGVGFSLVVTPDQKEAHLSAVRKEGYSEYNIRPEGDRDLITSIVFLEPLADRNLRAFGYDMFSEPVRRKAMERSRDKNLPAMSGKVRLVQEYGKKEQAGFLIYVPVYKNGLPHDTLSNRKSNIIGWVYSPFRMNDLMEGIFGEHSQDIDVEIYDNDRLSTDTLMYDSETSSSFIEYRLDNQKLFTKESIIIAGHTWTIAIRALPNLFTRADTYNPTPILIIGVLLSLLLGWLSWLLISGRELALKTAKKMSAQYIESKNTLQAILDSSAIGIMCINEDGLVEYVNPKFTAMFGYNLKDVQTLDQWFIRAYPDPNYRKKLISEWDAIKEATVKQSSHFPPMELEVTCYDGTVKNILAMGSWAGDKILVNFSDITKQKKAEELTIHMAYHDSLTNLGNRVLYDDRLNQAINLAKRDKHILGVLFIDLDNFKDVNDKYGHKSGDKLLIEVAKRIEGCLRDSDVVARMGGDEFLVLIQKAENEDDVKLVAKKILIVLNHSFLINEYSIEMSASIGIAIYPKHGDSSELLVKNADTAMYEAKKKGRNTIEFINPEMVTL